MSEPKPEPTPASAADQLEQRRVRERRRTVRVRIGMVLIVIVAMVILSIMNRDETSIQAAGARFQMIAATFEEISRRGMAAPPILPIPPNIDMDPDALRERAYYNALYERARHSTPEVGVVCQRWPMTRLIGTSGRWVILYHPGAEEQKFVVQWMPESEFQLRAESLGLNVPAE
jgi:hypothetical protein